jgi:quinol-cytochrome oxidoreductase complex cytochrome b subunit
MLANFLVFSVLGLILLPIYPPQTPEGVGAAYIGIEFASLGEALLLPTQYRLFGFAPLSPVGGIILMIVGVVIVAFSYRHQKPPTDIKYESDQRFRRSPPVEEVVPDSESVSFKYYYIILFFILLLVIFIV